jgi:hypothetical protein
MKKAIGLLMFLFFFGFQTLLSYAATDPRFFGTYCGEANITQRVRYRVCAWPFGWPCITRTKDVTLSLRNIRVSVGYKEPRENVGVIEGSGTARVKGKNVVFRFAGVVSGYGIAKGSVAGNYFGPSLGTVRLSPDGLALTISARGKTLILRKDACGNNPPSVSITSPSNGATLTYGSSYFFSGEVTADEDPSFPPERMIFRSNRDGILEGWSNHSARRISIYNNTLSPGNHTITFSATDSGGLTASRSISITVTNDKPSKVIIVQPLTTDTIIATGDVIFEGKAYDLEDGMLTGASLVWTAKRVSGPFASLGSGQRIKRSLDVPGNYTIRLTAVDSVGAESFTEQIVIVQPYKGNTTPRVTIEKPEHLNWMGIAILTGEELQFVGTAEDTEEPITDLELKWEAIPTNPAGTPIEFGLNSTSATATLTSIGGYTTEYTITFSATDSGGLTGKKTIKIYVMAHPIL